MYVSCLSEFITMCYSGYSVHADRQALKLSPAAVPCARSLPWASSAALAGLHTRTSLCIRPSLNDFNFQNILLSMLATQGTRQKTKKQKTSYFLILKFPVKPAQTRPQGGRVVQLAASRRCFSHIWTDLVQTPCPS